MASRATVPPASSEGGTSALESLLAVEREVAARLEDATAQATRLVEDARARLADREAVASRALADELAQAAQAQREAADRAEAEDERRAADECRHFDDATDDDLVRLADRALALVLGTGAAEGGA